MSFSILLENNQNSDFRATVLGLPDCQAEGATREAAIANVKQRLAERLATAEIVAIDFQAPSPAQQRAENDLSGDEFQAEIVADQQELNIEPQSPWVKYAGMFRDDPDFAEIAAAIRAEREVEDDTEVDPSVYSLES